MKCHHPEIFCAALVNAQPMGFYQPAQIVRDAREHGVEVRPVCIAASEWDCTLEGSSSPSRMAREERPSCPRQDGGLPGATGALHHRRRRWARGRARPRQYPSTMLRMVPLPMHSQGRNISLSASACAWSKASPKRMPSRSSPPVPGGLSPRSRMSGAAPAVPAAALEKLANADAFHALGLSRRQALWQVRGLGERPLPLFAAADRERDRAGSRRCSCGR